MFYAWAGLFRGSVNGLQKASAWVGGILGQFPDHDPAQVLFGVQGLFRDGIHPVVVDIHAVA